MTRTPHKKIAFVRLTDIAPQEIDAHMSDPRVTAHLPLLTGDWSRDDTLKLIAAKEATWHRDGLGHWAILCDGVYVGWGGFQKDGGAWDFGLVLTSDSFGLGGRITRQALDLARADDRIPFVTFLLPPSRQKRAALARLGAYFVETVDYDGAMFLKYRLETA